jgi:acetate kinase
MGMSPQSGLPQNNRVGDLDAFGLLYVMDRLGLGIEEARKALSSAGGLKALSGGLNDMREIADRAKTGDHAAELAREVFIREVRRWIGAYYLELGGLEALVFTGGIGENDAELRALVCRDLSELGIMIEPGSGDRKIEGDAVISGPESRVKVMVIKANEELVVAREAKRYLERREGKGTGNRPF